MKHFLLLLSFLFITQLTYAQCGSGTAITLETQTEVDNFMSNYCTNFLGRINIIDNNDGIDDITNVDGFAGLTTVGDDLIFYQSYSLVSLDGLSDLTTIGAKLNIRECPLIANVHGLSSLVSTGEFCSIGYTINMTDLQGLENLTTVGGSFTVGLNDALVNLDAVSNLTEVQVLSIFSNPLLTDIFGISNIDPNLIANPFGGADLSIHNNPLLSVCEVQTVCDFIVLADNDSNLATNINSNAPGCNSEAEVEAACNPCTPPITTTPTEILVCDDLTTGGQGQYQMQDADDFIRTDPSHTVSYFEDLALTMAIDATQDYAVTDATVAYAVVNDGTCDSDPVDVAFEVSTVIFDFTAFNTTCNLNNGGLAIDNIDGGTSPYSYSLNGGNFTTAALILGISAGDHTIEAMDDMGCLSGSINFTIDPSDPLDVSTSTTSTTCGESTGTVSLTINTGTSPISIEGSTPIAFPTTAINLSAGNYEWDLEDADGCLFTVDFTITAVDGLDITPNPIATSCNLDNGEVSFTVNQGTEPITYSAGSSPVNGFTDLGAGNYTWDAEDANGCDFQVSFVIDASEEYILSASNTAPTTCGLDNGYVGLTKISGDDNAFSIYNNGVNVNNWAIQSIVPAGSYTLDVVSSPSGCLSQVSFTIGDSEPLDVSTSTTNSNCGQASGSVTFILNTGTNPVSIDGGVPVAFPYTLSGLPGGDYDWDLEDADGCPFTANFSIDDTDPLMVTATPVGTSCNLANGEVSFVVNTGAEPITYSAGGSPVNGFTDLGAGNYTWDAEDANGCDFQVSFVIDASEEYILSASNTAPTTCGLDNGYVGLTKISGDDNAFSIYNNGVNVNNWAIQSIVPAGSFTLDVVSSPSGCLSQVSFTIGDSDPLEVMALPVATTCAMENGSVTFTTITGTDPVSYTENGASVVMTDLAPGNYTWDAEDAGGCMSQVSFTIDDSEVFEVTAEAPSDPNGIIRTRCNEDNGSVWLHHNGQNSIFIDIEDANGPITYSTLCFYVSIDGVVGTLCQVTGLPAGTYDWTLIDGTDCVDQVSFTVAPSDPLDITATPTATTCDLDNGEVSFEVNTGVEPITYSDNGTTITNFTGLVDGDYSWDAEDADGCLFQVDFTIDESIALTISTAPVHTFCDGNNGSVQGTMITGNGSATYTLNGQVNNTGIYTGLAPGTYTMTAADQEFCLASSTFTINGSDPLEITTAVTPTFCNEDNGSITATLDSGTAPVDYTIAGQGTNTTGSFTDLAPGTYTLDAVDAVGCEATETFTIAPSDPLDITTVIVHTTCEVDNGSVTATLMSGTTPVTFTIAGEGSNTAGLFTNLAPGNYTMNAEDAEGCEATVSFTINDSTLPLFDMKTVRTSCGDVNGSIHLAPVENTGRAPYEFNIGTGWTTDYSFENLNPGNYTVTIRDADGCMTSQATTILDSEQLVFINHVDHADCGNLSGVITLITLEGTGPFSYSISNEFVYRQNNSGTFGFLEAGQYTATVIGTDGCVVTEELTVENNPGVKLDVKVTHPACGEMNGSLLFNFGNTGTAPYIIYVDGTLVKDSLYSDYLISEMENGDYKIEVLDYYGCSDYAEITINDGNSIVEDIVITHINCDGNLGSISTIIGDAGDYTFSLGGETNTDGSFTELEAGTYTMMATDSMGCDFVRVIEILDNSFTEVRVLIINNECSELSNIKIIPENGNGPYLYFVNGKQYFENGANDLKAGFYTIKVIDDIGCMVTQEIKVAGESKLTYLIEKCKEPHFGNPGYLVVKALGGESPYRYHLDQYRSKKGQFINLSDRFYTLTIIDNLGCSRIFEIELCKENISNSDLSEKRNGNELSDVSIYPNPGNNILNIDHSSIVENQRIEVYSSTGHLIKQISVAKEANVTTVDTQKWTKGIYFIKIGSSTMIKWLKI